MAILDRYPYVLQYLKDTDGYEDSNGDYHEGSKTWSGDIPCSIIPSGRANEKVFEDGTIRTYSLVVYYKPIYRDFHIGDIVRVAGREYEVKGFQRYQLSCRLWL